MLERVARILGPTKSICSSGIAQLYVGSPDPNAPNDDPILKQFPQLLKSDDWIFTRVVGLLVLVIDRETKTFLFQIYDSKTSVLRFQCELYINMDYDEVQPQFHCFELDHCVAGFNFSDSEVANKFYATVSKLKPMTLCHEFEEKVESENIEPTPRLRKRDMFYAKLTGKPLKNSPPKVIGKVTGHVSHNTHVGLTTEGDIDLSHVPSEWKSIFREAGIRKKDLQKPEIAEYIRDALQSAGVIPDKKIVSQEYSVRLADNKVLSKKRSATVPSTIDQETVTPKRHSMIDSTQSLHGELATNECRQAGENVGDATDLTTVEDDSEQCNRQASDESHKPLDIVENDKELDPEESNNHFEESARSPVDADERCSEDESVPGLIEEEDVHISEEEDVQVSEEEDRQVSEDTQIAEPSISENEDSSSDDETSYSQNPLKNQFSTKKDPFLNEIETGFVRLRRISQFQTLPNLNLADEQTLLDRLKKCVIERRQRILEDGEYSSDSDDWSDDEFFGRV